MRNKLIAAAIVPALLALGACSSGSSEGSASAGGQVDLKYWLWGQPQVPAYQMCADAFHEANPDITVTLEQYGWDDYWTKLTASFVSGSGPDVFVDHLSKYGQFAEQKQIVPLDDQIAADKVDLSVYNDGLVDPWIGQDGETYGLPKDFDTTAFFYNKTMATEAGLTDEALSSLNWNPDDGGTFEQAIAAMTVDTNGVRGNEPGFNKDSVDVYGLGFNPNYAETGQMQWSNFTGTLDWQYLDKNPWGTHYNFDDPEFQKTLGWYYGLAQKGFMPKSGVFTTQTFDQLGSGKVAMGENGSWNAGKFYALEGIDIGVAPGPVGPIGTNGSLFNGTADSITAGTKHPTEAWEWVKFLGSTQCQDLIASQAIVFPAIKTSTEKSLAAFDAKGYDMAPFLAYLDGGHTFLPPITRNSAEVTDLANAAMESIYLGSADASVLTDVNDQINAVINK